MSTPRLLTAFAVSLALAGCPKSPETAPKGEATAAMPASAAAASADGLRIPADTVVASWKGGKVTYGQLYSEKGASLGRAKNDLMQQLYRQEQQELEGWVIERLMEEAASKVGKSQEDYVKSLQAAVPKADIDKFYEEQVKKSGTPLEAVEGRIREFLGMRGEIERLRKDADLKIDLPAPETPMVAFDLTGQPRKGPENAKVKIVTFSDFQCPYCSRAVPEVEKLLAAYPNDVAIYFLHFPLNFHQNALPAAVAADCAQKQNKFWEMHDRIFENQSSLANDVFVGYAKEFGLDLAKFEACLADPEVASAVKADMKQGEAAGVNGTPAFFINGRQFPGGVPTVDAVRSQVEKS